MQNLAHCRNCYVDHLDSSGIALFQRVWKLDLEGIVAKYKYAPHTEDREQSTWIKILNRRYSPSLAKRAAGGSGQCVSREGESALAGAPDCGTGAQGGTADFGD